MFLSPNWPAPKHIKAFCTTRKAPSINQDVNDVGFSLPPYDAFNLATHVGDDALNIQKNRKRLIEQACLPSKPFWLDQRHTTTTLCLDSLSEALWQTPIADASWTTQLDRISVVMTADCIPILVTNQSGTLVSAIHAGWKGLAEGIVTKSLDALPEHPENLMVWIGPCIRQPHFEVGEDVRACFIRTNSDNSLFFEPIKTTSEPKYLADLAGLLKLQLSQFGITEIYDSERCSYAEESLFYSYRRDGVTGRMASLIWIQE